MTKITVSLLLNRLFATEAPRSLSVLRVFLGWVFVKEGTSKLYGWFDGGGIQSITGYFQKLGIIWPELSAHIVGYVEFLGGIALILGFLVRPAAALIGFIMVVAILTAHRTGGYNYPALILVVCIVFLQTGAGYLSVDRKLSRLK